MTAEIPEAPDLCAGAARNTGAVIFGTKAESLETLAPLLRNGRVLSQVRFSVNDWRVDKTRGLAAIAAEPWGSKRVIVRSSARGEDAAGNSMAGKYDFVLGVAGGVAAAEAIDQVVASLNQDQDQMFVQPMLERVTTGAVGALRSTWSSR